MGQRGRAQDGIGRPDPAAARLFAGAGEMRARCRALDWEATPLGPVDGWPQSLRTAVDICLGTAVPGFLFWGPELVQLYNDAAVAIVRGKHPATVGVPARHAWTEVWEHVGPLLERALAGEAVRGDDMPLEPDRGGPRETAWFTFSYGPVRDEAGTVTGVFCSAIETTDRVRVEAALRESEARFRALATTSADVLYRMSPDWSEMRQLDGRGFLSDTREPNDAWLSRYLHPDDQAPVSAAIQEAVRSRRAFEVEHRVVRADGTLGWTSTRAVPLLDADGAIVEWIAAASDVTTRRQAGEELRASEENYRHIVEGAHDYAILTTDPEGAIMSWSPGAEAVLGWTADEAVGQPMAMTFVPEDRARGIPEEERAQAAAHGVAPDVRWHQRKDGARVFIDGTTRALHGHDGALTGFLKVGQNVTRRRELDEALRASEARYRTLLENVLDYAIFLLDVDGIVTEWTPGAQRVKGYRADEVVGRHVSIFYTPEDVAAGEPARELAEAATNGRAEREQWRVRNGGARFWVNEIMTAVHDAEGRLTGFTKISRDLTDRRLAEESADRVRTDAERDALRRQLSAAEEAERRRLARELHDQLGQHLTAFALGLGETRRLLAAGLAADARLTQLEELSRLMTRDARYLALELRPPELDDVGLESAVQTYVREWSTRYGVGAEVTVSGVAAQRGIPGDVATALYRIVQEALTNVAKHAAARQVSVMIDKPDGEVRLIVDDDGRGFDLGATAQRVRTERRLGLAGIRERAVLVGGRVEVEASPGSGTTIYVHVPLASG